MTTTGKNTEKGIYPVAKNKWRVVVPSGTRTASGSYKYKWVTVNGTLKDAQKARRELLQQRDEGRLVSGNKITLGDYLIRQEDGQTVGWLASHATAKNLAARTAEGYRQQIETHILPSLGHVRLVDLKPVTIDAFLTEKQNAGRLDKKGGLSPVSVRQLRVILHAALKDAVRWGMIPRNPAEDLTPRKYPRKEMRSLDVDEFSRFLRAVKSTAPEYYTLFHLLLFTGLRRSEALALTWRDVDITNTAAASVSVSRSLHRVEGKMVVGKLKTDTSKRTIGLPATAALALRQYREEREAIFHDGGKKLLPDDYVFSRLDVLDENGRPSPMLPDSVTHAWIKAVRRAGLKGVRLHDARHTHASVMLKAGVDIAVVQKLLGHSSIRITGDIYAHVLPEVKKEAAAKFDEVVGRKPKETSRQESMESRDF